MSDRYHSGSGEDRRRTSSQAGFSDRKYKSQRSAYLRQNFNPGWKASKRRSHRPGSEHSKLFELRKHYEFDSVSDDIPPLEDLRPSETKWDVKAAGSKIPEFFGGAGVGAAELQDRKQIKKTISENSRQFSRVDASKSILLPNNSRKARIVILKGIDLVEHPLRQVKEVLEEYLKSSVISGVQPQDCALKIRSLPERSELVILSSTTTVSTVLAGLTDTEVPGLGACVQFQRPNEYISSDIGQFGVEDGKKDEMKGSTDSKADSEIQDEILQCRQLMCIQGVPYGMDKDKIVQQLQKFGRLRSFSTVLDRITLDTKGIAFFTYWSPQPEDPQLENKLREAFIAQGEAEKEIAKLRCVHPCISSKNKYMQTVTLDADTMTNVSNYPSSEVTNHGESKVIRFANCISFEDLLKPEKCSLAERSFKQECSKFGKVDRVVISRPGKEFKNGLGEIDPSFGFIFVQFAELTFSTQCLYSLAGRLFDGRLVIGGYYDEDDFERGIY
ncbi:hypothetical protein HII12_004004 [Brettanomyces bruxellensis]|uniref:RRM domain-containing protein n=1 Tax=Dekkera bruxellensis TaxID=5007 RepID=A0A8H6BBC2_DEKBR|nr:hypothetical protein HII12_004004 [Brettanomyces bruxellensis]